ncbi:MAG: thiamine-phosphate diphosphorylase [Acidobacteria bacterium OLB17]|nr:MAG: thiamine-phosphate diphosphorylase [Acidobacteria bacterium OLB17]MCZ2390024.1 thiamine phosphate synthase [Acidobacteriota bacterium]
MNTERPITYLISRGGLTEENFSSQSEGLIRLIAEAAADGVSFVQIREKAISARQLYDLAVRVFACLKGSGTKFLVNDRVDIAAAAGCDGVHLTATSLPVATARGILGKRALISRSTHTLGEVEAANASGADIILYGPVFPTPGKGEPVGIGLLSQAAKLAGNAALLALGGVDDTNYREAIHAGASGFAAIRALNDPATRRAIIQEL